jgi:hypothetical protein
MVAKERYETGNRRTWFPYTSIPFFFLYIEMTVAVGSHVVLGRYLFGALVQRSPTDGPRENFGGPWRNLDIICNFYVYYTVSLYYHTSGNARRCSGGSQN